MPEVYDLYVTSPVMGVAQAIGSTKPLIVVDSIWLQRIGPGEQRALIAHELGHILSDHMVYMTALNILLSAGGNLPFFLGMPFRAVTAVLLEWFRAAELSCDRAAALAVRDPQIVCRLLMVLSGAMPASDLNLDAFMAQAMEYQAWDDPSDRVRRFFNELGKTHPDSVRRVSEVLKWVQSGEYDRIIRGEYRTREQDANANVRDEAGDAVEFYAERFRTMFREIGDNLNKAGSQVGGMAEQLADWLRSRGGGPATTEAPRPERDRLGTTAAAPVRATLALPKLGTAHTRPTRATQRVAGRACRRSSLARAARHATCCRRNLLTERQSPIYR